MISDAPKKKIDLSGKDGQYFSIDVKWGKLMIFLFSTVMDRKRRFVHGKMRMVINHSREQPQCLKICLDSMLAFSLFCEKKTLLLLTKAFFITVGRIFLSFSELLLCDSKGLIIQAFFLMLFTFSFPFEAFDKLQSHLSLMRCGVFIDVYMLIDDVDITVEELDVRDDNNALPLGEVAQVMPQRQSAVPVLVHVEVSPGRHGLQLIG